MRTAERDNYGAMTTTRSRLTMSEGPFHYGESWIRGEHQSSCLIYASLGLARIAGLIKFADQSKFGPEKDAHSILNDSREFLGSGDCHVLQALHVVVLCLNTCILLGYQQDYLIELKALCPMHGSNSNCF
jgi:hypothetical protein